MRCFLGLCLVAATAATSSANFIIDSFNGDPAGFALPGGVTILDRTVTADTVAELGTELSATGNSIILDYTFSSALIGTGDTLADSPSLTFDFADVDGEFGVFFDDGSGFVGVGSVNDGDTSFGFDVANLLSLDSFSVAFSAAPFSTGTIVFDRLTATPEPTSLALVGGMLGLAGLRRRRR